MQIIIVQKGGSLKEAEVSASWTVEELASKAGFRKHDGFALVHTYDVSAKKKKSTKSGSSTGAKLLVEVYGKQSGRAGSENKYDFPYDPVYEWQKYILRLVQICHGHLLFDPE